MSFTNPNLPDIPRQSVVGSEGLWAKMFDPPQGHPLTPDLVDVAQLPAGIKPNPVPEVMWSAGFQKQPSPPNTVHRQLCQDLKIPTWDGTKELLFYTFEDTDTVGVLAGPHYPGATIRAPRGCLFHGETFAAKPPHTIHWHGIEPTPMNDGVGHCSFELKGGSYIYQWQPNFIGTYFHHCHRNTMQHFEFGLFGLLLFEPPDAYFASILKNPDGTFQTNPDGTLILDPAIPIGHCSDGFRRTAANLENFSQFAATYIPGNLAAADFGINNANPHAFTVAYDVEALWVLDDRDSKWSDLATDVKTTFPEFGTIPGVNDKFTQNPGGNVVINGVDQGKFFAFNDFNADYWFVTGLPVPAPKGGTAPIQSSFVIPPELNSGISGTQIPINATVGQTIFIRILDAAYNWTRITFPLDVVIIEWDGRALGVPPFGLYNQAFLLKANTPITISTARRFGALMKPTAPSTVPATVEFLDTRSTSPISLTGGGEVVMTAQIPINIT